MGHGHSHHHDHSHDHGSTEKALKGAFLVTLIFMVVEFVGGWISNSLALMGDATHMLTDAGALAVGIFAQWISRKGANQRMSFGYQRAEILGALINGLAVWLLAGVLLFEAYRRWDSPSDVQGGMVALIAAAGLVANLISAKFLHASSMHNLNARGAYLHVLSDALGSVGALTAGIVIWLTGWTLIDPLMTGLIALLILRSSWKLVVESIEILMESTPREIDIQNVLSALKALPGVSGVHDLHVWSLSSGSLTASVHLTSDLGEKVLSSAESLLRSQFKIEHTTIQIDHPDRFASDGCQDCGSESHH